MVASSSASGTAQIGEILAVGGHKGGGERADRMVRRDHDGRTTLARSGDALARHGFLRSVRARTRRVDEEGHMADHGEPTRIDQATADRLSAGFHRCFEAFEAGDGVFAPDALFDLMPPLWRFQLEGPDAFVAQLRSIAEGPVRVDVLQTTPTTTGFVTEHVETQRTPSGEVSARRVHLCTVDGGRITAATTYCNGGWDDALRARHAAEAPMIRP
jgi:hypothetical protein